MQNIDPRRQVYDEETFVFPMWRKRAKRAAEGYGSYVLGDSMDKWHNVADSVEIPLMLFSGKCAEQVRENWCICTVLR